MLNKQIVYANTPTGEIDPSLNGNGTFKLQTSSIPAEIPADKLLVRVHYLSLDPAMRQWLTARRSYIAPVELGAIMRGQAVAQVLLVGADLQSKYKKGDWVVGLTGWQENAVVGPKDVRKVVIPPGGRPTDAMSVLGTTGLTAYFGMNIARPQPQDTVVVSGAAGATGMVAGQIAKIYGAKRVIGIAGGKDKCDFLKNELGFDGAVDYKDPEWLKQLKAATPEYINVYFDNVGGNILDACLARAAKDARFVICGGISQYNTTKPRGPASFLNVIVSPPSFFSLLIMRKSWMANTSRKSQRVTIKGFIVFDYIKSYPTALKDLASWLAQGKLRRKEYIIKGGLEAAPQGLVDLCK